MVGTLKIFMMCLILSIFYKAVEAKIVVLKEGRKMEEFQDLDINYSQPSVEVKGPILYANPPEACAPISAPPFDNSQNWFVLISGNLCDYGTKVIYAELAGYSAAVIYNSREDSAKAKTDYSNYIRFINISAVLVSENTGIIIRENYLYTIDPRFSLVIYINDAFDTFSFFSMMVAALTGLILVILALALIVKYCNQSPEAQDSRLSNHHLQQLPTSKFQPGDRYETCAICLEDFKIDDMLRILPCCHGYHMNCIDQWLTENRRICPICKTQVVFQEDIPESGNQLSRSESTPLLGRRGQQPLSSHNYRALSSNSYQDRILSAELNNQQLTNNATLDMESPGSSMASQTIRNSNSPLPQRNNSSNS